MKAQMMVAMIAAGLAIPAVALAGDPGECASGACGTPNNNGGGCGCGCGGSILVANTDIGDTYSTSDDYDGDGLVDDHDNCPFIANRDQADSDGDLVGDACDNCRAVANKDQGDINGNHIGDACDPDMDGDKILNAMDNCPRVPNPDQGDINKNGQGDLCDADMDGDGVLNRVDNCPRVYNPDQSKSGPGLSGNACDNDSDKDLIDDAIDNCPAVYNPDQKDTNGNGIGDACDHDIDGDTIENSIDNCPAVPNKDQKDSDHDGVGDACSKFFCFVAGKNRSAKCLDPKSVFSVTAAPEVSAKTGGKVSPALYANRDNTAIRYSWTITAQPDGGNDTVSSPNGSVSKSEAFEYRFDQANRPSFIPTLPGTYKLTVSADLIQPDTLYPTVGHAESTTTLTVTGDPMSGCTVGGGRSTSSYPVLAMALALLALVVRRRRAA